MCVLAKESEEESKIKDKRGRHSKRKTEINNIMEREILKLLFPLVENSCCKLTLFLKIRILNLLTAFVCLLTTNIFHYNHLIHAPFIL